MVTYIRSDLEFILAQIKIAEANAAGTPLPELLPNVQVPFGLRTVSGDLNNLVVDQDQFGAADTLFPRLVPAEFRPGYDSEGTVIDAEPRVISNLIVDQTDNNPAAVAAAGENEGSEVVISPGLDGIFGTADDVEVNFIPNVTPDAGLSAPFNAWMTFFGQFFDHGLDLVTKGGNELVIIPLAPDDPLYVEGGNTNFMLLTRATQFGAPGINENTTSPFVDQNQTYTSHSSHQVFLRAYELNDDGQPVNTGNLITNRDIGPDGIFGTEDDVELGGMATWAVVKAQARDILGINLTDAQALNVPLLLTDDYGNFIPGPNGFPQVVMMNPDMTTFLMEGDPAANGGLGIDLSMAVGTGHQFLIDIAHAANPVDAFGNPLTADADTIVGTTNPIITLSNGSFEADSMEAGQPGVNVNPLGNFAFIDPQGWDVTGFAGVFAPTEAVIAAAGHEGGNVVFLDGGATLVRNTGVLLQEGAEYQMVFNVGDRLDQNFGGGTARLVTVDGDVLATVALPTPADGTWAEVSLTTGPIGAANAGEELRIEILHGGASSQQILIDNVQLNPGASGFYDNELLDAHYIAGDGRANENIGLTAVHSIFHSEHNRLVEETKQVALATGDVDFLNEWLLSPVASFPVTPAEIDALEWNGERLFQSAKFGTEMQYQHLVFEEFARTIQPNVDAFLAPNGYDTTIDAAIVAEFAHTVYRFGHSMLTETVDRFDADFNVVGANPDQQIGLIAAFLNPLAFADSGATPEEATGALVRGLTRQVGNEIDEFVTEALRNNLLGLPLDLPAINIARGRDTGVPSLNHAREQFYEMTGDSQLKPYISWADFALHLKHPESLINFVAAYGTHEAITSAASLDDKRAAAATLIFGDGDDADGVVINGITYTDRLDFLNATGAFAADGDGPNDDSLGGLNLVDFWIGGLAEEQMPFGGLLGSTFNFVFETQLEALQDGDRFYYLSRTAGLHFGTELENNSFAKLVMLNSDATHLANAIFTTPTWILEIDQSRQFTDITTLTPLEVANASFEAQSLEAGQPGVNVNPLGNFTIGSPTDWTITGPANNGGLIAPAAGTNDPAGHAGPNVVWLRQGSTLSQNTGEILVEGAEYTLKFAVGDRTDQPFPGGTARLIATDGVTTIVLATVALTTPIDGGWAQVSLSSGEIDAASAGLELRVEIQQDPAGGANQILIDDIEISRSEYSPNADPTGGIFIGDVEVVPLVIRDNPNTIGPDTNYLQYTGGDHVVLGGTSGNDILISSVGDDTLYGDEGDDFLDGGYGNDVLLGGAGDDILNDQGGDNRVEGGEGNDVIVTGSTNAGGENLILGGAGKDFIVTAEDISTIFGSEGDDFILGAKTNLQEMGGEGDDWIERGTQDGAPGDNFSPFELDNVNGNDVFVGGGGFDEFIGEGGDDIMVGSDAQDKMAGMSGFDWVTYQNDRFGVTADMRMAIFLGIGEVGDHIAEPVAQSPSSIFDRFFEVEGLSGSAHADILKGDDVDRAAIDEHGGEEAFTLRNIALIDGLQEVLGEGVTSFVAGNIILGGEGSDIIEGRGGDDLIDGDKSLHVRISVRENIDGTGAEIASFDSMEPMIPFMLNRTYNPGQLQIVREILDDPNRGFDTAVFSGNLADYTIAVDDGGTPEDFSDDIVTVTDNIVDRDGIDTLKHVERLQFADQSVTLVPGLNDDPVGELLITDTNGGTLQVGDLLTVSAAGVTDADNVTDDNLTGAVTGVIYTWQVERDPGTGVFEDIILEAAGDLAFQSANGQSFRIPADVAGLAIRAKGIYLDDHGVAEQVFSAATAPVDPFTPPPPTTAVTLGPVITESGPGVQLIRADLDFILDQIKIAEAHSAGADLLSLLPNVRSAFGLRTVSGEFNNLIDFGGVDQTDFGAADTLFPRLLDPEFREGEAGTTYDSDGMVIDSTPRTISNLIVDQTANNPAAVAAAAQNEGSQVVLSPGLDGIFGTPDDVEVNFIPNIAPDEGLSAPFNAWMTFFGQFFDHGLDLVTKGGNEIVFMPLNADDPLFVEGSPTNFMVLTRATQFGAPGINENTTSPFVDQNQTYTSHPSHQVFLRAYELNDEGQPVNTGNLITNRDIGLDGIFGTEDDVELGGMATWAVVKAQARDILGIELTDDNVFNAPLLATDLYGNFIPDPDTGFPQIVLRTDLVGDPILDPDGNGLASGSPSAPISANLAMGTGHQFLIDIAHAASPVSDTGVMLAADSDDVIGLSEPGTYDNELLDAHYIAGDGRANENIGLTAVHSIFHSEHNRLVEQTKETALLSQDVDFLNEWLMSPVVSFPVTPAEIDALEWNGERLFQVAKFGTEMQYQHLVFEEFARTIQPNVDLFFAPTQVYDLDLDASIVAEFAHTVYRFGHSMLTETVDRFDVDFNVVSADPGNPDQQIGLIAAFLNPLAFAASGATPEEATGALVRGLTREVGNEIDEFVTEALRNNLVGLPLDLASINIARGRDTGVPSLNHAREQFYDLTGDANLRPYTSWVDFVQHIKHPESLINFIAAYGTHASITGADTLLEKRAAATVIVLGGEQTIDPDGIPGNGDEITFTAPTDRFDFLNATGAYAGGDLGGLNLVDFWIGGLAEQKMPFGGMLGSTFNFVFENQLEKLQDGDRFYYLDRVAGQNFVTELEGNSFAKLIMANSDATHLPGVVFLTPTWILETDPTKQFTGEGVDGRADPLAEGPFAELTPLVIRDNPNTVGPDTNYLQYTGPDHVVLGGTAGNDILISSEGDDTLYGDEGNDRLEGGDGNDTLLGGDGDDIITDTGGDDLMQGGDGNDVIHGGNGINLIIGGFGQDFIVGGEDSNESFGGGGNDFILGSKADEQHMGGEGDDWIEGGTSDGAPGDNFDPFGNDPIAGNDVFIGRGENDKFNAEGGDDIMVGSVGLGDRYIGGSGYDWATFKDDDLGVYIDLTNRFFDQPPVPGSGASVLTRFDIVEGLSGSHFSDVLIGDNEDATTLPGAGARGSVLTNIGLIDGLQGLLDTAFGAPVTFYDGGNIILGGEGGDILEGRGGDDILDGDAWLNVRISVRENVDGTGEEIASFDSMEPMIPFMLDGTYNPGQLQIVREILTTQSEDADTADFDTAVFTGNLADYTIETLGDVTTVTDSVVDRDGVDRLMNIERLRFADQTVVLVADANAEPVGDLTIDGVAAQGELLTVSIAGVTDADNVTPDNPDGAIPAPVSYFWQADLAGDGVFTDIEVVAAGEIARVEGRTFMPTENEVGLTLRVRAVYKDANGVLETVFSAPTAIVANIVAPVATDGDDVLIGTLGPDVIDGLAGDDTILGLAGDDLLTGGPGDDTIDGGDDNDTIEGNGGADLLLGGAGNDTIFGGVGADDIRGNGGADILFGGDGADEIRGNGGADQIFGDDGADTILGGDGADEIFGGDGADDIDGGDGADVIFGGANADTILGGAGQDELFGDDGADTIDGGDGLDMIDGGAGADTLLGGAGADTIFGGNGADEIDGGIGQDIIDGGNGNDTLTGGSQADMFVFTTGFGTDTITDFSGQDFIDISAFIGLTFGDLTIVNNGADAEITAAEAGFGTIIVENVPALNLGEDDFLFG